MDRVIKIVSLFWDLVKFYIFLLYVIWGRIVNVFFPRQLKSLEGEIILLTGAGNGIGKRMAHELSCLGAQALILWDIETEANEKTANELKNKNSRTKIYAHTVDITKKDEVRLLAAKIRREIGHVTAIVNNAGIVSFGKFLESTPSLLTKVFDVNLFSHFWIIREFLPKIIEKNHGHVVTIASIGSFWPSANCAAYVASKHGVYGFIETLKQELREMRSPTNNIKFTTIYPMGVETRAVQGIELRASLFDPAYLKVTPEYVAEKAVKGFRQNYEHLFLPPNAQIITFLITLLPTSIFDFLFLGLFKLRIDLKEDYCMPGIAQSDL